MFKTKPADADNVVDISEEKAVRENHSRLSARARAIEAELTAIGLADYAATEEHLDDAAKAYFAGHPIQVVGTEQRAGDLRVELDVVRRALQLSTTECAKIAKKKAAAVAARIRPDHQRVVARLAAVLCEASRLLDQEEMIRSRVPHPARLASAQFPGIGSLDRCDSNLRYWLRSVRQSGALPQLPAAAE